MTLDERCELLRDSLLASDTPAAAFVAIAYAVAKEREAVADNREVRMKAFEARQSELTKLLSYLPPPPP